MIRLLNVLAFIAVISSATWAYSVKYETILVAEKLRKREAELGRERDAVAILQAEWHLLNRPERMQSLAKPEAGMNSVSAKQIVRPTEIPLAAPVKSDAIDSLLTGSIPTPESPKKSAAKSAGTTPSKAGQGDKATTPSSTAARTTTRAVAKTGGQTQAMAKASGPLRLVPPANVGAKAGIKTETRAPAALASAPVPEQKSSNPLTSFLKKLMQ